MKKRYWLRGGIFVLAFAAALFAIGSSGISVVGLIVALPGYALIMIIDPHAGENLSEYALLVWSFLVIFYFSIGIVIGWLYGKIVKNSSK